jgi:hypothetical protein
MRVEFIDEPELQFADGTHVDVRAGIATHGALDREAPSAPKPIRAGFVGTTESVAGVRAWLQRCGNGVESDEPKLTELRPTFPGMTAETFGTTIAHEHEAFRALSTRELTAIRASRDPLQAAVDVFLEHASDLAAARTYNVLVIAPPAEVFSLGEPPAPATDALDEGAEEQPRKYAACFHDLFKARALDLGIPCQLIRPETYGGEATRRGNRKRPSLQDEATRAWNFHTALYYKAGAVPWRLVRQSSALATSYVGVSFFRSVGDDRVTASVAQVFDERGEGVIVRGGHARVDKDDRTPHLNSSDAAKLVADALAAYRREHRTNPARLVLHKTSYFDSAELEGCKAAADDAKIEIMDLLSLRRSRVRLFREGTFPVLRGSSLLFDDESGAVHLRGSVPQFRTYPGMYVPTSLEFQRAAGESTSAQIAAELMALSKLNFNNTQFDGSEPITVRAARRVGDILKHADPHRHHSAGFRFFT